jgi:hypothetical protein
MTRVMLFLECVERRKATHALSMRMMVWYPRAEAHSDREGFVVRVADATGVLVAGVGAAKRQKPEVAAAVLGDAVVFGRHLVAIHTKGTLDQIHHPEVRDGNMGSGRRRRREFV